MRSKSRSRFTTTSRSTARIEPETREPGVTPDSYTRPSGLRFEPQYVIRSSKIPQRSKTDARFGCRSVPRGEREPCRPSSMVISERPGNHAERFVAGVGILLVGCCTILPKRVALLDVR
jgi:hypothetical protein